ncbi:unnamed protein product [Ambrosiozyma monospora]|uniref:Unnamed protein product n=1 Tax=Ambrosiozyma monospora TaxID=43982 RepID=A0A9W6YKF3_AMBMO|nr:unnamed protein product [Ambrosiozyma monospora]
MDSTKFKLKSNSFLELQETIRLFNIGMDDGSHESYMQHQRPNTKHQTPLSSNIKHQGPWTTDHRPWSARSKFQVPTLTKIQFIKFKLV